MFDFSIFQTNAKLAQDAASQMMLATGEYTKAMVASTTLYSTQVQDQITTAARPGVEALARLFKKS